MATTVLSAFNLKKTYHLVPIFEGISFQLNEGEKVALVGVNGAGKTTILEILAGVEDPDTGGGQIVRARGVRMAYLPQEVSGFGALTGGPAFGAETTLWDAMLDAMGEIRDLQREMSRLEAAMSAPDTPQSGPAWDGLIADYEAVTGAFELAGGYELEHRIEQVLEGLGFRRAQFDAPLARLSGGQKTRAALAHALLAGPDLLLLDEPTNHLDLSAIEWLETFLQGWPGTLLCASHDRRFLDKVSTRTLDLDNGVLESYPGNYTRYLALKAERMERRLQEFEAQQEQIAKTEEFIRRFKAGQRSKEAKGREKRLKRVERLQAPRSRETLKLELQAHLRSGRTVLATEDLEVGFRDALRDGDGPPRDLVLARCPDLEIERGARVALIGPNGTGKTSLLRTALGELPPLRGQVIIGHNVHVAYYAQAHEGLDPTRQALDEILRARPMTEEAARNLLGRFLFSGDDVYKRVGDLSGGERSRVALAKLTLLDANFLMLDEPTNHLDLGAREALEEVLGDYTGTLLFVSHDRAFIDSLATQTWVLNDGLIEAFEGNYSDYLEELARRRRENVGGESPSPNGASAGRPKTGPGAKPADTAARARQEQRAREEAERAAARARASAARRLQEVEALIGAIEERLNLLSAELDAASAAQDLALVTDLGLEYQQLAEDLEKKYGEWERLAS